MKFIKKNELELANGGYLVFKEGQLPVNHEEFVTLQEEAHYLVSLANKVSMTDFTSKQPISFQSVVDNVTKSLIHSSDLISQNTSPAPRSAAPTPSGWLAQASRLHAETPLVHAATRSVVRRSHH
mgnify:CR=1 FL=1